MKDLKGYLRPEEVKKVIEHGRLFRDRLMMRILWASGCRLNELLLLTVEDIAWKDKTLILWTLKRRKKVQRRVQVDSKTLKLIKKYCGDHHIKEGLIFHLTGRRVEQLVYEAGCAAGIPKVGSKRIHPHHFRHSHSVAWIRHPKNRTMEGLRKLQQRLGHASIASTAHYLQFASEESAAQVEETFGEW